MNLRFRTAAALTLVATFVAGGPWAGVITPAVAAASARSGSPEGPALLVPIGTLDSGLHCPARFSGQADPVLLIHGATQTGASAWSWNYGKTLPAQGFDVCAIDLPDFARGDVQVSTEYVVRAVRTMSGRTQRRVDVISFSQGALEARWALRWWPDLRSKVDDVIMLAAPNHGITAAAVACSGGCVPSFWQLKADSEFLRALNSGDPTPGTASYTSVFGMTDELDFLVGGDPDPWTAAAALDGAANIRIQDLCPGRPVEHVQQTYDAAVNAVVLDSLSHPGPADAARIAAQHGGAHCGEVAMAGVDPVEAAQKSVGIAVDLAVRLGQHQSMAEPPLAAYARP